MAFSLPTKGNAGLSDTTGADNNWTKFRKSASQASFPFEPQSDEFDSTEKSSEWKERARGMFRGSGYANYGSLEDYFSYTRPPTNTYDLIAFWTSMFETLAGLQDGTFMGFLNKCHGDIRPTDILAFAMENDTPYECEFKLGNDPDVGKKFDDKFRTETSSNKGHFFTWFDYAAPEVGRRQEIFSQTQRARARIWTMGCIYSEALVWSVFGIDGRAYYKQLRRIEHCAAKRANAGVCFHDGHSVVKAVGQVHLLVCRFAPQNHRTIISGVLFIVDSMLSAKPERRMTAQHILGLYRRRLQNPVRPNKDSTVPLAQKWKFFHALNSEPVGIIKFRQRSPRILDSNVEDALVDLLLIFLPPFWVYEAQFSAENRPAFEMMVQTLVLKFARNLEVSAKDQFQRAIVHFLATRSGYLAGEIWRAEIQFRHGRHRKPDGKFYWSNVAQHLKAAKSGFIDGTQCVDWGSRIPFNTSSPDELAAERELINAVDDLPRVRSFVESSPAFAILKGDAARMREISPHSNLEELDFILSNWLEQVGFTFSAAVVKKLRMVMHHLNHIEIQNFSIECQDKPSITNTLKGVVEDKFGENWNWWPLKPHVRKLRHDEVRVYWNCGCGEICWEEVPESFAEQLLRACMALMTTRATQGTEQLWLAYVAIMTTRPAQDSASQTNSMSNTAPLWPSRASISAGFTAAKATMTPSASGRVSTAGAQTVSHQPNSSLRKGHVFLVVPFGRRVGDEHRLAQRDMQDITTSQFFIWLRQEYYRLVGFFHAWFGLREFSHCDFYKFRKTDAFEYSPLGEEYPEDEIDYYYAPRPMKPVPPIDSHEFNRKFNACYQPRPHLHWYNRCRSPCHSRLVLNLFPQRYHRLVEQGDNREEFWGLYVVERFSFFRVLAYNICCMLPSIVFFFMWLFAWKHPGDLQNASVPIMATITALTVFWGFLIFDSEKYRK